MMNEREGEEADLINSFFLPGGILDPVGFSEDDDENDQNPSGSFAVPRQPLQQNPWAGDVQIEASRGNPPSEPLSIRGQKDEPLTLDVAVNAATLSSPSLGAQTEALTPPNDLSALIDNVGGEELPMKIGDHSLLSRPSPTRVLHEQSHVTTTGMPEVLRMPDCPVPSSSYPPQQTTGVLSGSGVGSFPRPPPGFEIESRPSSSQEVFTDRALKVPMSGQETDQESTRSNSSVPHDVFDEDKSFGASATSSLSTSTYGNMLESSSGSQFFDEETEKDVASNVKERALVEEDDEKIKAMSQSERVQEESTQPESVESERRKVNDQPEQTDLDLRLNEHQEDLLAQSPTPPPPRPPPTTKRKKSRKNASSAAKRTEDKNSLRTDRIASDAALMQQSMFKSDGVSAVDGLLEAGKLFFEAAKILVLLVFSFVPATSRFLVSIFSRCKNFWPSLSRQLRNALHTLLLGLAEGFSVVGLMWNSARLEVVHNRATTTCFLLLYFLPVSLSFCMRILILPHWIPHAVSCLALYILFGAENSQTKGRESTSKSSISDSFCKTVLRLARYSTILMFLFDGFDSEYGMIFGMKGSGRIVFAYLVAAFRQELGTSPLVWVGAALQVLAALYLPAAPQFVVDIWVAGVAFSSYRLARFIDAEMRKGA